MKMVKSLLLGTAAGLVAVAGAQAADMPVKAKPVQFVKICTLYGDGFYYVPGTDTCLKLGGYVRVQVESHAGAGGVVDGTLSQVPQAFHNRVQTNDIDYRVRGALSLDVRDQTEYGTLRSYFRIGVNQTTPIDGVGGAVFWDRAFIQWAGFTVGKAQSFFDTVTYGGAYSYHNVRTVSDTGASGWNVWAYTAQLGNGWSATLSLEDPNRFRSVVDVTAPAGAVLTTGTFLFDNAFGAQGAANNGMRMPDVILNVRLDQAWGYWSLSGALHDQAGAYYGTPNNVNNGHPTDRKGWAVGTGFLLNLAGGDKFGVNFQYAKGAAGYGSAGGSWLILDPGRSAGIGLMADGIFGLGGEISESTVWNAIAFYEHRWNARWKTSIFGGYVDIKYDGTATGLINERFPVAAGNLVCGVPSVTSGVPTLAANAFFNVIPAAGNSCSPDFSYWQAGTRTQWNPHPNLDIGIEFLYTKLNTAYKGALAPNGGLFVGPPQNPVFALEDQDVYSLFFRWQRNFYP